MSSKNKNTRELVCQNCGRTGARLRNVTRNYGKGGNLLIVENVPVVTCPHCGESYMTAATAREIARIKSHRSSLAIRRKVSVAAYV
ncbi:MAG TPA: type II toxin-antitoxin system MqsA family antitoxin [Planctomycetota bacterium]|nr:type II toxin-antitoxin system MqsA family antitoxin [Planctomycetota bacterium]